MPGQPIKPSVLKELQRQLNHELSAAYSYEALSLWCEAQNLKGFARYFIKQSVEERGHARKFMSHLLDRAVRPELGQILAPRAKFDSLLDIAKQAQSMERENTAGIHACYDAAQREKDFAAQAFHWFINEQVEEEDWTDEMVERVERANCAGGFAELDRHIERYLTDEPGKADQ